VAIWPLAPPAPFRHHLRHDTSLRAALKNTVNQLEHWNLPGTDIACASVQLVLDVSAAFAANHNIRYLFAREPATAKALQSDADNDDEMVFLSCILHDLGLNDYGAGDQRFKVGGADAAVGFSREHDVAETRVSTVWQSVALHTRLGLARAGAGS
jgi:hypothetical protein